MTYGDNPDFMLIASVGLAGWPDVGAALWKGSVFVRYEVILWYVLLR